MKKVIIAVMLLVYSFGLNAQEQEIPSRVVKPADGKCLVYITRQSAVAPIIKFSVYDGEVFLGKLGPNRYFAYECDPGEHVFIARSENTSYVEAHLEAGRTYVIDAEPKMGIGIARVSLKPLDKSHPKYEKQKAKFFKFVSKKKGELLQNADEPDDTEDPENSTPDKRMARFREMKTAGKDIVTLTPDMFIEE